jgi:hypothetical protein
VGVASGKSFGAITMMAMVVSTGAGLGIGALGTTTPLLGRLHLRDRNAATRSVF